MGPNMMQKTHLYHQCCGCQQTIWLAHDSAATLSAILLCHVGGIAKINRVEEKDEQNLRYIVEVEIDYAAGHHELHNYFPFRPELL